MSDEKVLTVSAGSYLMPVFGMEQAIDRYNRLVDFVRRMMKPGVDFGTIPGTDKPTLLKPGAERLTTYFGLTPRFVTVKELEDWTGHGNGGEPFFYYWFRCQLWRGDILVAEADGSCNSHESKYRWRWVSEDDLPPGINPSSLKMRGGAVSEFAFAVDKSETSGKYGKPLEYWQRFKAAIDSGTARPFDKEMRNGQKKPAWEIDSTVYRVPNDDIASQVNTVQKMAQKRALIAATLMAVNASEFFTQDLEDLDIIDGHYTEVPPSEQPKATKPKATKPAETSGKCQVCQATGDAHAPWCQEIDGERVDTRKDDLPAVPDGTGEPDLDTVFPKAAVVAKPVAKTPRVNVKSGKWNATAIALATEHPYYQTGGQPNFYKMLAAATKHAGVVEITDANLADVIAALTAHAVAEMEVKPGDVVEG
jgi:hypothetical protein